jgi:FkbM family methyltransferase
MAEPRTSAGRDPEPLAARHFPHAPDRAGALRLLDDLAGPTPLLAAVTSEAPLALYGAGNLGGMARDFLAAVGRSCGVVIDRNAATLAGDPRWQGHRLYTPDAVPDDIRRTHLTLVTVATAPYAPLADALRASGFGHAVPFYDFAEGFRAVHPLSNGWFAPPFAALDLKMIARALDGYADDLSRAHHLQFLAWRRRREEWTFSDAPVTGSDRFFIPEVMAALRGGETFLDAGAHEGSVVATFVARVGGEFARIVAVEPDPVNRAKLTAMLSEAMADDPRISVLPQAVGGRPGIRRFHAGLGYASQFATTGNDNVDVTTIDAVAAETGAPSFIKLHLEGAEREALEGGRDTLRAARPIIATTVYHNDDGIWRTPLWLMETLENYRFLFRLHSWCGTGAVLYAIPEERSR